MSAESRKLIRKGRSPVRTKEQLTPDAQFVLLHRDAVPLAYRQSEECGEFLHDQHFYRPRTKGSSRNADFARLIAQENRTKEINDKFEELSNLTLEAVCRELIHSGKTEWAQDMLRFTALRGLVKTKIKALPREVFKHVQRRTYANASSLTAHSFEEHLQKLQLTPEDLKGKRILTLGPGSDFAFEKGAVDAGAELVVTVSYDYARHESPEHVHKERPNLYPVRGIFQELPPMTGMFDLEASLYAFPRGVDAMADIPDEKADIADIRERYVAGLSLLDLGAEYRSYPVMKNEIKAVKSLPKKLKERVEVDIRAKNSWGPDLMVIRVAKKEG